MVHWKPPSALAFFPSTLLLLPTSPPRKGKVSNQSTKSAASFTNYTTAPKQRLQLAEIQVYMIFRQLFVILYSNGIGLGYGSMMHNYFLSWVQWQGQKTGEERAGRATRRGKGGSGRKFRGQVRVEAESYYLNRLVRPSLHVFIPSNSHLSIVLACSVSTVYLRKKRPQA